MNRKAFITWGGWSGHEPEQTSALFAKLLAEKGFAVERVDSLSPLADTEKMKTFDLIVPVWTMSSVAKEELRGLLEAVRSGVGIGGWHGGMGDAFRQETEYQWMVGGQWVAHPGNAIDYTVEVVKNDPITAGIGTFAMHSEQYYMHTDPGNEVLAVTRFDGRHADWIAGTIMPAAWKRHYGKGRVFYCSLGHVAADFDVPEARELTLRGLLWAAHAL